MATHFFFADGINITQSGNFKSDRKFWDLKQMVDWMYKLTVSFSFSSGKWYFGFQHSKFSFRKIYLTFSIFDA